MSFNKTQHKTFEELSRTRLSKNFILRDFLFSTEAACRGHSNFPSEQADQVEKSGRQLCAKLLEPILEKFGRFAITFGYQSRETMDLNLPKINRGTKSSSPHHWDRGTFGYGADKVYARVDILPFCVEDGLVSKNEFGRWCMMNLDLDLLMQWRASNVFCMTISPYPRRVWHEWVPTGEGDNGSNRIDYMGRDYWTNEFPSLPVSERPKFSPSMTGGSIFLSAMEHGAG